MNILPVTNPAPAAAYPVAPAAQEQERFAAEPPAGMVEAQDTSPPAAPSELSRSNEQLRNRDATSQEVEAARIDLLTGGVAQSAVQAMPEQVPPSAQQMVDAVRVVQDISGSQPAAAASQSAVGDTSRDGVPV